ncbi:MAG TPA: glycogen-binding domain-containing protein [Pyrinomonadaceae bacterium]|nr:glycogen-binding domain-containing protein [Pyrinomonadaceae bacterium]
MKRLAVVIGLLLLSGFPARPGDACLAQSQAAPAAKPAAKPKAEILKKYVGRYSLDVGIIPVSTLDVTLEGETLWVKPSTLKKRKLIQKTRSRFLDEVEGTSYVFNKDADGNYSSLTFEYEGSQYTAQRVALPPPSLNGNTTFRLQGFADAGIVALAGTFNNWDQSQLVCGREGGEWVCRVDLEPGEYSYKFIVDGNWVLDPDNPNTVEDEAGNTNNVLVKK